MKKSENALVKWRVIVVCLMVFAAGVFLLPNACQAVGSNCAVMTMTSIMMVQHSGGAVHRAVAPSYYMSYGISTYVDDNDYDYDYGHTSTSNEGRDKMIVIAVVFGILLISYIIARYRAKHGHMVVTANIYDKILVICSPILFFIVWCIGFGKELSQLQIILIVLSGLMLLGSILFSIFANIGSFWSIILSVLAKIFIFVLTNIILIILILILFISIFRLISSHDSSDETYIMKYDSFLDQWICYKVY